MGLSRRILESISYLNDSKSNRPQAEISRTAVLNIEHVSYLFCSYFFGYFTTKHQLSRLCSAKWDMRVYPKISELPAWSQDCTLYSFLPLGAVVSLFC